MPAARARRKASLKDFGLAPLVILFILNAVDEFDRAVLAVSIDDIREEFGLSDFTVAFLPVAVIFITGTISLPAGNWADRYKRINILAAGAMVWGTAGILAATSRSFIQLFLTRALLGFGQGTIVPTHASLLSDYYPVGVRGRALSYHRSANSLGQVVGAVVGGVIVGSFGWRWAFTAAAVPGLLLGIYALRLREPGRGEADLLTAAEENPLFREFLSDPPDKVGFIASLGEIFSIPSLKWLIFTNAAFGFSLFGVVFWMPALFERHYDFTTEAASGALGAMALAAFVGSWLGGPYADRCLARGFDYMGKVGVAAAASLAVTWTIAFLMPNGALCLLFLAIGAFFASMGTGGLVSIIAAVSPPRIRSQAFSAFGLALAVCGAATAPMAVGALSTLLQEFGDMNRGESLLISMLAATTIVMAFGTYMCFLASRTCAADVQKTMSEFLAGYQARVSGEPDASVQASGR